MTSYTKEFSKKPASASPKHILIFLDGTWNDEDGKDGDGITTNIYRMFRSIAGTLHEDDIPHRIESENQVALYFRGVGNDEDNGALGTFYEGAFGAGEKRIRDHAYVQLVDHYAPGDSISIFGFSRGAACARLLAAKIHKYGILSRLTATFEKNDNDGVLEEYFLRYDGGVPDDEAVDVQFLGIFDTVGAFGVPVNLGFIKLQKLNLFRNLRVAENIRRVVHCVSLDESREPFVPTLCNHDEKVEEVWFPGVHSDVGGGYRLNELGKISLNFMVKRLREYFPGNPVQFDQTELDRHTQVDLINDRIHLHYHGEGFKKYLRDVYVSRDGEKSAIKPRVHKSVVDLKECEKLHLVESTSTFVKLTPILYLPDNLAALKGNYEIVE
ncbi:MULTISPECIES: DUF2235 domain-containing protein [unclassified Microbulbifer]|uniref:DUF2235 domain-containing protein n=1 Tax=unclassified Microbulbifer TaxID=2619833 RepID=UPI0027E481EA|nr:MULTISPECIES: DUF2235 domain-containing protein [unclassified Microbulbifer]